MSGYGHLIPHSAHVIAANIIADCISRRAETWDKNTRELYSRIAEELYLFRRIEFEKACDALVAIKNLSHEAWTDTENIRKLFEMIEAKAKEALP